MKTAYAVLHGICYEFRAPTTPQAKSKAQKWLAARHFLDLHQLFEDRP